MCDGVVAAATAGVNLVYRVGFAFYMVGYMGYSAYREQAEEEREQETEEEVWYSADGE